MSFVQVPPDSSGKKIYSIQHVIGPDTVQAQAIHLADAANPEYTQKIDIRGAARVSFTEGQPTFDAVGNMRTAQARVLGYYDYVTGPQDDLYWIDTQGAGATTWDQSASSSVLSVGSSAADSVKKLTNRYHFYQPGTGVVINQTRVFGDTGRAGNTRMFGHGDDTNGLFWILQNTTFGVMIRSATSGSTVETFVPKSAWNGDPLDGTGDSKMTLDITQRNYFWIDYVWLGVGPVRFGVMSPNGARVTCHTFENPGNGILPYMGRGSLPLFNAVFNTGNTGASSEMRIICDAVYAQSETDYLFWRHADLETQSSKTVTTETPILSVRPKVLYQGKPNRVGSYPEQISVNVVGGSIKLRILQGPVLTGATWAIDGDGPLDADDTSTAYTDTGYKFVSVYLKEGVSNIDLKPFYETNDEGIQLSADGATQWITSFSGTNLGVNPVTVDVTLTYRELS